MKIKIYTNKNKSNYIKAFTLIELLVVIAIIALLSAVVLSSLAGARMKANDARVVQDIKAFRIAVEMYFNDNKAYPANSAAGWSTFNNVEENNLANIWSGKLSFFIKTAEAQVGGAPITLPCANFNSIAAILVSKKYLSAIPVHPYNDYSNGICYNAISSPSDFSEPYFVVYAPITTDVRVSDGTTVNKKVGFFLGSMSPSSVSNLKNKISSYTSCSTGRCYPAVNSSGGYVDAIDGITNGEGGLDSSTPPPPPPSSDPRAGWIRDPNNGYLQDPSTGQWWDPSIGDWAIYPNESSNGGSTPSDPNESSNGGSTPSDPYAGWPQSSSGFLYDQNQGAWLDPSSGLYIYDPASGWAPDDTGYYFSPSTGQYFDPNSGNTFYPNQSSAS